MARNDSRIHSPFGTITLNRADKPYETPIDDTNDPCTFAAAVNAEAQVLVTGDKSFQSANPHVGELLISSPRGFLEMTEDE